MKHLWIVVGIVIGMAAGTACQPALDAWSGARAAPAWRPEAGDDGAAAEAGDDAADADHEDEDGDGEADDGDDGGDVIGDADAPAPAPGHGRIGRATSSTASTDDRLAELAREEKRTDRPGLAADRAAITTRALVGSWGRGAGATLEVEQHRTSDTVWNRIDSSGEAEVFTFLADGTYRITGIQSVDTGTCASGGVTRERGTYAFDGRTLTLTVEAADGSYTICGDPPAREVVRRLPAPRRYAAGLAPDGRLILVGPSCGAHTTTTCHAVARWEMRALAAATNAGGVL